MEKNAILEYIQTKIHFFNTNIQEQKRLEENMFGKNLSKGMKIIFESQAGNFFEGFIHSYEATKLNSGYIHYNYRVHNSITGDMELCPIHAINGVFD